MTMTRWFTKRDREQEQRDELLSAYLDGRLGAEERARLEAQLATDPVLRAELEALRRTVALVRDLPRVAVPRNFILPQTMAARPRPVPLRSRRLLAPLFTAATSIAVLLFVVVLVGDLLSAATGRRLALAPAAAPAEERQAVMITAQVELQDTGTSATAPALAVEAPAEEAGEEDRLGQGTLVATSSPPPSAPAAAGAAPEEGTSAGMAPPQPAAPAFGALGTPAPTPTPAAEMERASPVTVPSAEGAVAATPSLPTGEGYNVGPAPTEAAKLVPSAGEGGEAALEGERFERETGAAGRVPVSPWRAPEIALGLAALALGAGTVWAWRARRR
jgi:hypothetical protein